jgi:23S rRNA (guanine2445-N2)-methyltransferase / 23S rRNA (guanine2069-N7)-methyltransferase
LARELVALGAADARERSTGVTFSGDLEVAYRACLWSRVANRVFLELARFEAVDAEGFYNAVREIDWTEHLGPGATLACDFSGQHPSITHTHFGALKLKDAIVDSVRDSRAWRPSVELERPSVRVHAHAHGNNIALSLDLSGESLHRRGYRGAAGEAPLKENVAAGVLLRSGWPDLAASSGGEFLDPMCGSGTFVIEAALIAADYAPGLGREYFGFLGWAGHDTDAWERLTAEARARARAGLDAAAARGLEGTIRGTDRDGGAVRNARGNAERAGVQRLVRFEVRALADAAPMGLRAQVALAPRAEAASVSLAEVGDDSAPRAVGASASLDEADGGSGSQAGGAPVPQAAAGLLCTNPPYGIRLEDRDTARAVHRELGAVLRERFQGWNAAVLTGTPEFGLELGIRAHRTHTIWNGAIECRLLRMKVDTGSAREVGRLGKGDTNLRDTPGAQMFANRLGKNFKKQQAWADRSGVSCYRLYDADMPEYAFAIDVYRTIEGADGAHPAASTGAPAWPGALGDARVQPAEAASAGAGELTWLYVQEYAAPAEIELESVRKRRGEALSTLSDVTGVAQERVRVRTRRKNKRGEQYNKVQERETYHVVMEDGLKFLVNFDDYLDTGLFLDHRVTRGRLRAAASGKRFLNLFAYTCTATVYAAAGGAASTTSVDMSNTYLNWAQRNFELNGLSPDRNGLVQADCRVWLQEGARSRERYDLIFIDPPTFSNSKRMEGVFDVERDHPEFIDGCVRLLAPGGLIVFSTNSQRFRLDESLSQRYDVRDISAKTLPKDFERNPRIHRCFEVRVR